MTKVLTFASILLFLPLSLFAQQKQTITLEEAIQIAIDNNFQLQQARNNVQLSEFRKTSAMAEFLPNLSANANRNVNIGRQFDDNTGDFGDFTINSFSAGLSSNMTIFNSFANINGLRAARSENLQLEEELKRVKEDIIFQTATRYLQYLLDVELLEISRENLETSLRQLEQIEAQVEVGARPSVDLLNQESIVANNELAIVNRENALNSSRLQIIQTLQIDPLVDYEFILPDLDDENIIPLEYSLQDLVSVALDNRSDLRSEQYRLEVLERNLQITRANQYPSISLSGSISSRWSDTNPLSFEDQFTDQNVSRNFGVSITVPIFNRLNVRENVQASRINLKNATLALENTRLNVVQEVNQALNDYNARIKELESTERALRAAERAFETENQRYDIGASTLIELSQANNAFVEAQSNRVQAVYNFIFQSRLLDYYLGQLDENLQF
ncbi:MAG: TolC family protein [Balneolaceae bacterium]